MKSETKEDVLKCKLNHEKVRTILLFTEGNSSVLTHFGITHLDAGYIDDIFVFHDDHYRLQHLTDNSKKMQ